MSEPQQKSAKASRSCLKFPWRLCQTELQGLVALRRCLRRRGFYKDLRYLISVIYVRGLQDRCVEGVTNYGFNGHLAGCELCLFYHALYIHHHPTGNVGEGTWLSPEFFGRNAMKFAQRCSLGIVRVGMNKGTREQEQFQLFRDSLMKVNL